MRIRKHAKISPLLYASSSLNPGTLVQPHVCQLNQSPWDVMAFSPPSSPPPPSQANGSGAHVGNGSSDWLLSVAERELSSRRRSEYRDSLCIAAAEEENKAPPVINEVTIMCCKTDGKSWQCRREAAEGNSLCEHHLSLNRNYSSVAHHAAKKSGKPAEETQRRTRAKKALTSSSSNPYEFYYYAGFGPRWGKRRDHETRKNIVSGSSMPKNLGDTKFEDQPPAPAASYVMNEYFDFEEYEDEDEEEHMDNGKKRVRKPIKARSLKSLCEECVV